MYRSLTVAVLRFGCGYAALWLTCRTFSDSSIAHRVRVWTDKATGGDQVTRELYNGPGPIVFVNEFNQQVPKEFTSSPHRLSNARTWYRCHAKLLTTLFQKPEEVHIMINQKAWVKKYAID